MKMTRASRDHEHSAGSVSSGQTHTPGPWSVNEFTDGSFVIDPRFGLNGGHNVVGVGAITGPHAHANARLIAAAPDLLALLKECADDLEAEIQARASGELPRRIARDMDTVVRARAAIAKAGGRS
jgi:hypothetical protein